MTTVRGGDVAGTLAVGSDDATVYTRPPALAFLSTILLACSATLTADEHCSSLQHRIPLLPPCHHHSNQGDSNPSSSTSNCLPNLYRASLDGIPAMVFLPPPCVPELGRK